LIDSVEIAILFGYVSSHMFVSATVLFQGGSEILPHAGRNETAMTRGCHYSRSLRRKFLLKTYVIH